MWFRDLLQFMGAHPVLSCFLAIIIFGSLPALRFKWQSGPPKGSKFCQTCGQPLPEKKD